MSGRETTVASVPSDNATFDEDPGAAQESAVQIQRSKG
jgi:hypothetical protein